MVEDDPASLALNWAAILLLHSGDIGGHLKEFEGVFPGLGGQVSIKRNQSAFLLAKSCICRACRPVDQPVQADAVTFGNGDQRFQASRVFAVLDIGNV